MSYTIRGRSDQPTRADYQRPIKANDLICKAHVGLRCIGQLLAVMCR